MGSQIITLSLPAELLAKIDEAAKANYTSRSGYIRQSVVQRLNQQPAASQPPSSVKDELKLSDEEFLQQLAEHYGP